MNCQIFRTLLTLLGSSRSSAEVFGGRKVSSPPDSPDPALSTLGVSRYGRDALQAFWKLTV
jgi:hypothetical protein